MGCAVALVRHLVHQDFKFGVEILDVALDLVNDRLDLVAFAPEHIGAHVEIRVFGWPQVLLPPVAIDAADFVPRFFARLNDLLVSGKRSIDWIGLRRSLVEALHVVCWRLGLKEILVLLVGHAPDDGDTTRVLARTFWRLRRTALPFA